MLYDFFLNCLTFCLLVRTGEILTEFFSYSSAVNFQCLLFSSLRIQYFCVWCAPKIKWFCAQIATHGLLIKITSCSHMRLPSASDMEEWSKPVNLYCAEPYHTFDLQKFHWISTISLLSTASTNNIYKWDFFIASSGYWFAELSAIEYVGSQISWRGLKHQN